MRVSQLALNPRLVPLLVLVALACFVGTGPAAQTQDGKEFAPAKGKFSIVLPGEPKEHKQTTNGIDNYAYIVDLGDKGVFAVSYFDIPAKVGLTLDTAVAAFVKARKGKVISTKKMTLNDEYPGREVLIELPGNKFSRLGVYIVRERYFQIGVEGTREIVESKTADAVFSSFKLKD
jgi:hypothetical protein